MATGAASRPGAHGHTPSDRRRRVLLLLDVYPQHSQTYVKAELEALAPGHELRVLALRPADRAYRHHLPYTLVPDRAVMPELVREFRPDVIHTHYLQNVPVVAPIAAALGVPFTVRTHSFDVLGKWRRGDRSPAFARIIAALNGEWCLGALAFPFLRPFLEERGLRADRLVDCFPVIAYDRFRRAGPDGEARPDGDALLAGGACLPKHRMEDFLQLAARLPGRDCNLFAIGYDVARIRALNRAMGSPANMIAPVEPEEMGGIYRRHGWLVYTACRELGTMGWPLAVAEAQAAGLGVCVPDLRPDLAQYLGGAGFLYRTLDEVARIVARPYPEEMRARGRELARRCDIRRHLHLLTDLWPAAAVRPAAPAALGRGRG